MSRIGSSGVHSPRRLREYIYLRPQFQHVLPHPGPVNKYVARVSWSNKPARTQYLLTPRSGLHTISDYTIFGRFGLKPYDTNSLLPPPSPSLAPRATCPYGSSTDLRLLNEDSRGLSTSPVNRYSPPRQLVICSFTMSEPAGPTRHESLPSRHRPDFPHDGRVKLVSDDAWCFHLRYRRAAKW